MNLSVSERELQISHNHKFLTTEKIDYKNCVCVKPWGYEFLAYESEKIGIWCLTINKGHSTSLHCHFKKDTILFVLSGCAKIGLIDNDVIDLPVSSYVRIPKNKFHSISSFSDVTTLLEVEVFTHDAHFSDKNDLLRIDDQYLREKTGYAQSINIDYDISKYGYFWLGNDGTYTIDSTQISVDTVTDSTYKEGLIIDGTAYINGYYAKEGSFVKQNVDNCKILTVSNPYMKEDSKIIYSIEHLECVKNRLQNNTISLTSGCFDILHVGHIHNLKTAKQQSDVLIVCLSSDNQIKKIKGPKRPINNIEDRLNLFKTISYVDYVVLYDENNIDTEETLDSIIKVLDPDIWFKGDDYKVEDILAKHPSLRKVSIIPNILNKSTTEIVKKCV